MRRHSVALTILATLLWPSFARAHDTWILPSRFRAPVGTTVTVTATSGMAFPAVESPIGAERIAIFRSRLAGQTGELKVQPSPGADRLDLPVELASPGIAAVGLSTRPREIRLKPSEVEEYLAEIGAPDELAAAWRASGKKEWVESYRKHATTFVRVGEPYSDTSFREPLGLVLELVPRADPTLLRPGQALGVQVLFRGRPLAGLVVTLVAEGGAPVATATSAEDGSLSLPLPSPGRWLLRATHLRAPERTGGPWVSDFATLAVRVEPGAAP